MLRPRFPGYSEGESDDQCSESERCHSGSSSDGFNDRLKIACGCAAALLIAPPFVARAVDAKPRAIQPASNQRMLIATPSGCP